MREQIFQIAGCIAEAKITQKNSIKLKIESQENVSPEAMKRMCELVNQLGYFTFNVHEIEPQDIIDLPPLRPTDAPKTKSQIMRGVLYLLWQKDSEGIKDSEEYYNIKMDKFINHLKGMLD